MTRAGQVRGLPGVALIGAGVRGQHVGSMLEQAGFTVTPFDSVEELAGRRRGTAVDRALGEGGSRQTVTATSARC